ncbi:MAG: sugar ABC transporter permease, partial [Albidovulum sp.]
NALVLAFGGVPRAWMTLPFWNSLCLMIILIWIQTGFAMVVLGAALRRVPDDLREAAMLDGASAVQALFRIILPQIWGPIGAVWMVISIITFKVFDIVLAMTNGQWNTNVLANLMFNWMFQGGGDFGRGAAIAVVLMGMIMPVMLWVMHKIWRAEGQGR